MKYLKWENTYIPIFFFLKFLQKNYYNFQFENYNQYVKLTNKIFRILLISFQLKQKFSIEK